MTTEYRVTRWLDRYDIPWLPVEVIGEGETLYPCTRPTYGCIGYGGVAVTLDPDGDYPFFEVPADAVRTVDSDDLLMEDWKAGKLKVAKADKETHERIMDALRQL